MAKKPDKKNVVHGLYYGLYAVERLPKDVYYYNAEKLMAGVKKGFGKVTFEYNSPDYKLYESIGDNVYMFSGAKTFQQVLEMNAALLDKDGVKVPYEDFKLKADEIFDKYNETWLNTEYETAIDSARMGAKWNEFQENRDEQAYLMFVTIRDETVCEECEPLDGIIAHIDDPFWSENYPPIHFKCHCDVQPTDNPGTMNSALRQQIMNKISLDNRFKNNVGKTGLVFIKKHPYFHVPEKYKPFAKENFGLPVPFSHNKILNRVVNKLITYPKNHKLGMEVPKGGSDCAKCIYVDGQDCLNKLFIKWNGGKKIPMATDKYCCDLYEMKK